MSILCLDFDGVIHSYTSGWQGPRTISDPPVPGAIEFLLKASEHFEIHIFSSRSRYLFGRWAMKQWLRKHVIAAGGGTLWVETDDLLGEIKWPKYKPPAMVTIDDRALTFTGEWPAIDELKSFKPWNK